MVPPLPQLLPEPLHTTSNLNPHFLSLSQQDINRHLKSNNNNNNDSNSNN